MMGEHILFAPEESNVSLVGPATHLTLVFFFPNSFASIYMGIFVGVTKASSNVNFTNYPLRFNAYVLSVTLDPSLSFTIHSYLTLCKTLNIL